MDFTNLVNLTDAQKQEAGLSSDTDINAGLKLTQTSDGKIVLSAESIKNETKGTSNTSNLNAEINISGGSQIIASGVADDNNKKNNTVEITAMATHNAGVIEIQKEVKSDSGKVTYEKYYKVAGIEDPLTKAQYEELYPSGSGSAIYTNINTNASINIDNTGALQGTKTTIQGERVDIEAIATNNLDTTDFSSSNPVDIEKLAMSVFFQGIEATIGMLDNKATVNIGADTVITATGIDADKNAVNIQANATEKLELGANIDGFGLLSGKFPNASLAIPGIAFVYGVGDNKAEVTLGGTINSNGSINVESVADNTFHSSATTSEAASAFAADGFLNVAFNNVKGSNNAKVDILNTATLTANNTDAGAQAANQNVYLQAETQNDVEVLTNVATGDEGAISIGLGFTSYSSEATLNVNGAVKAKDEIRAEALGNFSANDITVENSAGTGWFWSILKSGATKSHTIGNLKDGIGNILGLIGEDPRISGAFEDAAKFLKFGISLNKVKESNVATVAIGENGSLVATNGNTTVSAQSLVANNRVTAIGASNNFQNIQYPWESPTLMVNGAILLSDFTNDANVIVKGGAGESTYKVKGNDVNIFAKSEAKYDRISLMKTKLTSRKTKIDAIVKSGEVPENTTYLWNKYNALTTQLQADLEAFDEASNKDKDFQDFSDKLSAYSTNPYVVAYNDLVTTGTCSYTDDAGTTRTATITQAQLDAINKSDPSVMDKIKTIADFVNPESYMTYHAGSDTRGQADDPTTEIDETAAFGMSASYASTDFANNSRVLIGNNIAIQGNKVEIKSDINSGDVTMDGQAGLLLGGSKHGGGIALGMHDQDANNIITIGENSSITSGSSLDIKANLDTLHIGVASALGMSANNTIVGNVQLFDVVSNNLIAIDDEASLDAQTLNIEGNNKTSVVSVTGGFAMAKTAAIGIAFSDVNVSRNNIVGITDTDGVQDITDKDIANSDDEETRLRKLLAKKIGVDKTGVFGAKTTDETAGTIAAHTITNEAKTDGNIILVSVDAGLAMASDDTAPGIGDKFSNWLSNKARAITDPLKIADNFIAGKLFSGVVPWDNIGVRTEAVNPDAGKSMPSFSLAGAGSISLADLDGSTAAIISSNVTNDSNPNKLNISLKNLASGTELNKLNVKASDDSLFVNVSGGVAVGYDAFSQQHEGFSSIVAQLTGGVAYNQIDTSVLSKIKNSKISNVDEVNNTATREGASAAAAAAIDVAIHEGEQAPDNFGLSGGVSINTGSYSTKAILENNDVNTNANDKLANVNNLAVTKDLEVTGALEITASAGQNANIGIGVSVTRGYLGNDVEARVTGGTYNHIQNLSNQAITDLTQISAVIGGGVSKSTGDKTNVAIQGAVAYNSIDNDVNAKVENATINALGLDVKAYDTKVSDGPNKYASMLQDKYHVDTDGAGLISKAKENNNDEDMGEHGGLVVTGALQFTGANSSSSSLGVAVGGSVAVNNIDNNYNASVDGVTFNNDHTVQTGENAVAANVKAESSNLIVDVAAGVSVITGKSGFSGSGSIAINNVDGSITSNVSNSNLYLDTLDIQAENKNKLVNVAADLQLASKSLGVHNATNTLDTLTSAKLIDTNVSKVTHNSADAEHALGVDIDVTAQNTAKYYAIAAGAGAGNVNITGAIGINFGHNDVEAIVKSTSATTKHSLSNLDSLNIHSSDNSSMSAGAGGLYASDSHSGAMFTGASIGGAFAWNDLGHKVTKETAQDDSNDDATNDVVTENKQFNKAVLENYTITTRDANASTINLLAEDKATITTVAAGVAVAVGEGSIGTVDGTGAYTRLYKDTEANSKNVDVDKDKSNYASNVKVAATTNNSITDVAAVVSVGLESYVATGAAVAITDTDTNTKAHVDSSNMKVNNLFVNADGSNNLTSVAAGGTGGSNYVTASGSVNLNTLGDKVTSYIDGGTYNANNNIGVTAHSKETLNAGAGALNVNVPIDQLVSVALALSLNKNDYTGNNVSAYVKNATVDASGKAGDTVSSEDKFAYIVSHDYTTDEKNHLTAAVNNSRGLVVDAYSEQDIITAAATAGLQLAVETPVSVDIAGALSISEMGGETKAYIENSDVNKNTSNAGDVTVTANNNTEIDDVAVNASVGVTMDVSEFAANAILGFAANKVALTRDVSAEILGNTATGSTDKKQVNADKLKVRAGAMNDIDDQIIGVGVDFMLQVGEGASIALNGNAQDDLIYSTNTVTAKVDNIKSNNKGMDINAAHDDKIETDNVGVMVTANIPTKPWAIVTHYSADALVGYNGIYETNSINAELTNSEITHNTNDKAQDSIKATNYSEHDIASTDVHFNLTVLGANATVNIVNESMKDNLSVDFSDTTIQNAGSVTALADNYYKVNAKETGVQIGTINIGVSQHFLDVSATSNLLASNTTISADSIDLGNDEDREIELKKIEAAPITGINVGYVRNYVTINEGMNTENDAAEADEENNKSTWLQNANAGVDNFNGLVQRQLAKDEDHVIIGSSTAQTITMSGNQGDDVTPQGMNTSLDNATLTANALSINNVITDDIDIYTGTGYGSVLSVVKNRAILNENNLNKINILGGTIDVNSLAINSNVTGNAKAKATLGYVAGISANTSWAKVIVDGTNEIAIQNTAKDIEKKTAYITANNIEIKANNDATYTAEANGGGVCISGGDELTTVAEDNLDNKVAIKNSNIDLRTIETGSNTSLGNIAISAEQTSNVQSEIAYGSVNLIAGGVGFFLDAKLNSDNTINLAGNTITEAQAGNSLSLNALYAGTASVSADTGSGSTGGNGSGTAGVALSKGTAVITASGNTFNLTNIDAQSLAGGMQDGNAKVLAQADVSAVDISLVVGADTNKAEANIETTSNVAFSDNTFTDKKVDGHIIGYREVAQLDENGNTVSVAKVNDKGQFVDAQGNVVEEEKDAVKIPVMVQEPIYEQVSVGKTKLNINADTSAKAIAEADGVNVGVGLAVGHKQGTVNVTENTSASFAGKAEANTYLDTLKVKALGINQVKNTADGSGGGLMSISPDAASTTNNLTINTNASLAGKLNIANNFEVAANQKDDLRITTTISNGGFIEIGGGDANNTLKETTKVDIANAVVTAKKGNIIASNDVNLNREGYEGSQTFGLKGSSGGGWGSFATTVKFTNDITTDAKVDLKNAKITTDDSLSVKASTLNNVFAKTSFSSGSGVIDEAKANVDNTHTYTNSVTMDAKSTLKTLDVGSDISIVAADDSNVQVGAYANANIGVSTIALPTTDNEINRNNNLNIAGTVNSGGDTNLYAGDYPSLDIGGLDAVIDNEAYSGSLIPIYERSMDSKITQTNSIAFTGTVNSIGDVNLSATDGAVRIKHNSIRGTLYRTTGHETSEYVSWDKDNVYDTKHVDTQNSIALSGAITAGANHQFDLTIGTAGEIVILDSDERAAAIRGGNTVNSVPTLTFNGATITEEQAKDRIGEIKYYSTDVTLNLLARYEEINKAITTYSEVYSPNTPPPEPGTTTDTATGDTPEVDPKSIDATYQNLLLERQSIVSTLLGLGVAKVVEEEGGTSYIKIDKNLIADVIELPDIVSGGGNVSISTDKMSGTGSLEAYGSPEIVIQNNTNMYTKLNNVNIDKLGGRVIVNNTDINCSDATKANQEIGAALGHGHASTEFSSVVGEQGDNVGKIDIQGLYNGTTITAKDEEGNEETIKPYAAIELSKGKTINDKVGSVYVRSTHDSLIINGNVHGTSVTLLADNGDITQISDSGVLNVGGSPEDNYKTITDAKVAEMNFEQPDGPKVSITNPYLTNTLTDTTVKNPEESAGRITGGNILLGGEYINVNGLIQSGYADYVLTIDDASNERIQELDSAWNNIPLKDSQIMNEKYRLTDGGMFYDETERCYKYQLASYYNPSTKKIVVDNLEAYAGNITLAGTIMSTGNGRIMAMDGKYDVTINNRTGANNSVVRDIQLGEVMVTDVTGKITINDIVRSGDSIVRNTVTEITKAGTKVTDYKNLTSDNKPTVNEYSATEEGYNPDYSPYTNLRYAWNIGTITSRRDYYEHKVEKNWWGLNTNKDAIYDVGSVVKTEEVGDPVDKDSIAYGVIENNANNYAIFGSDSYLNSSRSDIKETTWKTGLFGWKKHWLFEWNVTTGASQQYVASVKADNPIDIGFIGKDNASVTVNSTYGSIDLTGNIGSNDKDITVNLTSGSGHITQNGSYILANTVNLEAAGHMENISINSGNELQLLAKNTASRDTIYYYNGQSTITSDGNNIDIIVNTEVIKAEDGTPDYGRVFTRNVVGNSTNNEFVQNVNISTNGSIVQGASGLISARRIDLTAENGTIGSSSADGHVKVNTGDNVKTADSLTASLNAKAKGNISIEEVSGDLRVGQIYSDNGDVNLKGEGSLVDALPYESITANGKSDDELIAHWTSLGLFEESKTVRVPKVIELEDGTKAYEYTTENTGSPVYELVDVKDKEGKVIGQTRAQKQDAQGNNLYYVMEEHTTVKWDPARLLYAVSDELMNPESGVETSTKMPNIKGHNITIEVGNSAGLNDENEKVFDLATLGYGEQGLEDLKFLSKQDASDVEWNKMQEDGTRTGKVIVRQKLPIGIEQSEGGILTITAGTKESSTDLKNVYVEARAEDKAAQIAMDMLVNSVTTHGNVMLKNSMGGIFGVPSADGTVGPYITANNLELYAGGKGSTNGLIGRDVENPFYVNIGGQLRATGTGDINIYQLGDKALEIYSVSGHSNINLTADTSILGTGDGFVRLEQDGTIMKLVAKDGNVGGPDGQRIRVVNSKGDETEEEKRTIIVEAHHINDDNEDDGSVYIYGNQTPTESFDPGGTLYIDELKVGQKGTIDLDSFGSIFVEGDKLKADNVKLTAAQNIDVVSENELKLNNVTISAGRHKAANTDDINDYGGDVIIIGTSVEIGSTTTDSSIKAYDANPVLADNPKGKVTILSTDGNLKNNTAIEAGNHVRLDANNGNLTINNSIENTKGGIEVYATYGETANTGFVNINGDITAGENGLLRIYSELASDKDVQAVIAKGELKSVNGSVDIGAQYGHIDMAGATVTAGEKGMAAVGTNTGSVEVGTISAGTVVLYNKTADNTVKAGKVVVGENFVVQSSKPDIEDIHVAPGASHIRLDVSGAGGKVDPSGEFNIGSLEEQIDYNITNLAVGTANIKTGGNINIGNLYVNSDKTSEIIAKGNLGIGSVSVKDKVYASGLDNDASIYGRIPEYDGSKAIYYNGIMGSSVNIKFQLNLGDLFFGKINPETGDYIDKQPPIDDVLAKLDKIKTEGIKGNDNGMNLYMNNSHNQTSNGKLVHYDLGYYVHHQRYSAEDLSSILTDYKSSKDYDRYNKDSLVLFSRHNLYELPSLELVNGQLKNTFLSFELTDDKNKGE